MPSNEGFKNTKMNKKRSMVIFCGIEAILRGVGEETIHGQRFILMLRSSGKSFI